MYVEELKYRLRWKPVANSFPNKKQKLKAHLKVDKTISIRSALLSWMVFFFSFLFTFKCVTCSMWFRQVGTIVLSASIENKDFLSLLKRDST